MSSETAIRISGLSKSYQIARERDVRATNLGEAIVERIRNPLKRSQTETFWALKEIDLEIKKGEVVGVIGRNGAGKSTLLKILSRITEPTNGRIELFGRVGSLLEVGTGFHPELTGRENIYLNGAILGMRKSEITRQFDAIVDFAEVEKFLDTPVKRYSSGMYVRLAFAVAAHLNPEILIVDEVLAVGDAEFQKKCLGKMKDVACSGRAVLFVSHQFESIRKLCSRAVLLSQGSVAVDGAVDTVMDHYATNVSRLPDEWVGCIADDFLAIERVRIFQSENETSFFTTNVVSLEIEFRCLSAIPNIALGITILSEHGTEILYSHIDDNWPHPIGKLETGSYRAIFSIPPETLASGKYHVAIDAGIQCLTSTTDRLNPIISFDLINRDGPGRWHANARGRGFTSLCRPACETTLEEIRLKVGSDV